MSNLSEIKTADLLNELASRPGVEKVDLETYASYELKLRKKYGKNHILLKPTLILSIENLDHLEA